MINCSKKAFAVILICILGFSLSGCHSRSADKVSVTTTPVKFGKLARHEQLSGVLVSNRDVKIYSKVSGQAKVVGADVGDQVKAGQLLVQIDTKELNAQLLQAQAAVNGVRDQISQVRVNINNAQSNLSLAQKTYDRTQELYQNGAVAQSQLDDVRNKLDQANNAYQSANQQYQTLAGSGLAQAEAAVNLIQVQISNGTIVSPISGTVTSRSINPGEIASSSTALMTIADTSILKMQMTVPENEMSLLTLGQKVSMTVDAIPGRKFTGKIVQIGPTAVAAGGDFPVMVSLTNSGGLMAGMTAQVSLDLLQPSGIIVPQSALHSEEGHDYVYIVKDGQVSRRQVVLGLKNDSDSEIVSGVYKGEEVATSNLSSLQNGMKVKIKS